MLSGWENGGDAKMDGGSCGGGGLITVGEFSMIRRKKQKIVKD